MAFKPVNPKKKPQRAVLPVSLTLEESEQITQISKRTGISKQELIRQMIDFCVDELAPQKEELKRSPGRPQRTPSQELYAA